MWRALPGSALVHAAVLGAALIGFAWLMHGPIHVLNGTANWLLARGGVQPVDGHERLHSSDEIRMLVEQSGEGGSLGKEPVLKRKVPRWLAQSC